MIALLLAVLPVHALSLDEARDGATRQAIAVEQARAQRDAAQSRAWSATADNLPAVVGFASANTGSGFTAFGFPRPVQTQAGAGVRGSWALLSPADWGAASAARQTALGQSALLDWAVVEARRAATEGWSATQAAQITVAALEQAQQDADKAAAAVADLVAAGLRPPADAARATAEAADVQAQLATARWQSTARCMELNALLRRDTFAACDLDEGAVPAPAEGPSAHPALRAARATLAAARGEVLVATGAVAPRLDGDGTAAWYTTSEESGGFGWSAGLELTVPLMASGAGAANRAAARSDQAVAELALEDQERALRVALSSAEARLRAADQSLDARSAGLAAAAEALRLVSQRYDAGVAPLTDWLDARRQRDLAAVALAAAVAERGAAVAAVESARGVGR